MSADFTITTNTLEPYLRDVAARARNKTDVLVRFAEWWHGTVLADFARMTYKKLWPNGSEFRAGIFWKGPAPLYVRKTTGERLPPWGAVARILKPKGAVKGRKRPSGARVTPGAVMMQDTGNMIQDFLTAPVIGPEHDVITWFTNVPYADEQNALRPFNQFTARDQEMLGQIYRDWLVALFKAEQQFGKGAA